jgi:hypothetical protein
MLAISQKFILAFGLVAFITVAAGCKLETKPCATDVAESVSLKPVKGSNHLLMSVDKLDFLSDSTIIWDDIELSVTLKGKRVATENITLSFNGFKFNRKDSRRLLEGMEYLKNKNHSSSSFKLHKMYLNGALPFHHFLARIKKNKGVLQVHLNGKNLEIIDAKMTFKGKSYSKCAEPTPTPGTTPTPPGSTPTPTPTPVPVAPETSLDSMDPAKSPTAMTTMAFGFSSTTEGNSFYCSLDNSAPVQCTSPQVYSDLVSGDHSFKVYAQSPQGLSDSTPASYSWKVDTVAPSVSISNSSSLPTLTQAREIRFEFSANKAGSTFKCSLDGAASVSCSSPMVYSALGEGVHMFSVNATDSLGNVGKVPDTFRWNVDVTAPVASFIDVTPGDAVSNSLSRSFTFSADESATFECSFDGSTFAACSSSVQLNNLSEGPHSFEIRATDMAGNVSIVNSFTWENDMTAPEISLGAVSPAQGLTNAKNVSVEFSVNEPGNTYCSLDGAAAVLCQSPFAASDLAEGSHSVQITAVDASGNVSAPVSLEWNMDLTAPVLSFGEILPSAASNLNVNSVSIAINAPQGALLYASIDGAQASLVQSPLQLSNLSEGDHAVSVYGMDDAGNASAAIVHQFNIDMSAPSISLVAQNTVNPTNSDRNAFAMSSNEEVQFECSLDNAGFAACLSPMVFSGLADGAHNMQVRAIDVAGNISAVAQYAWVVDTKAPSTAVTGTTNLDQATLTISSDEAGVRYVCSLDGAVLSTCSTPMSYSGLALGTHSFLAKAIDAAGNIDSVGATYQFAITKPIKTMITAVTPGTSPTNQPTMTISFAADQANATFLCSIDNLAPVVCTSSVSYTSLSEGPHKFTVKAVDAFGNMDATGATYNWVLDTSPPAVGTISFTQTTTTVTVTWVTSEASSEYLSFGIGSNINQTTSETFSFGTTHTVKLTGLFSNTTYSVQVKGHDAAGNAYIGPIRTVKTNR